MQTFCKTYCFRGRNFCYLRKEKYSSIFISPENILLCRKMTHFWTPRKKTEKASSMLLVFCNFAPDSILTHDSCREPMTEGDEL